MLMREGERYPVRCRECGWILATREGNLVISCLKHRNRKKEVRVKLESGQSMWIDCDHCGQSNQLKGN